MELSVVIPPQVEFILSKLEGAGFEAYIVGGAVRDIMLKRNGNYDYDFTTNAQPEQILELFPDAFYENNFGTVMVTHQDVCAQMGLTEIEDLQWRKKYAGEGVTLRLNAGVDKEANRIIDLANAKKVHESLQDEKNDSNEKSESSLNLSSLDQKPNYEITTFRSDGAYQDHRRPDEVVWGTTLKEDVDRRDFTINALALKKIDELKFEVIDYHEGIKDLKNNLLRTVGDPNLRFKEDSLRILRAIRFAVQLNLEIDDETFVAIKAHAPLIKHISWERIRDEFMKILASNYPAEGVELLDQVGLLELIIPELLEGKGVKQGGHHTTDVWTHSIEALRETPTKDPVVRLATLLHDVAKPRTYAEKDGKITFYNHEIVGSRLASKIAKRLKLSKKVEEQIFTLVRYHMFHYQTHDTDAAIRRFMRRVGLNNIDDILDLREGDRLGSGARKTSWRLEEMKQRMIDQLNQPMDLKDLKINGTDLMSELKLQPGRILGEILNHLFELVLDNPELNTREQLLKESQKYLESIKI